MPDLLTHTLFVYPLKYKLNSCTPIVLMGAILPDVFARIPGVLLPHRSFISWAQAALHSPFSILIICYFASLFFEEKVRKTAFKYLLLGAFSHLFLDLFQKTLTRGYFWLFPFSFDSFSFSLIWPNDTVYLVPFLILLNIITSWGPIKNLLSRK